MAIASLKRRYLESKVEILGNDGPNRLFVTGKLQLGDNINGQRVQSIHRYVTKSDEYAYDMVVTLDHAGVTRRHIVVECEDGWFRWANFPLGFPGRQKIKVDLEMYDAHMVGRIDDVIIADSETSADALIGLKRTATASPLGTGQFLPKWLKRLEGKHVVIMPDNNPQSRIEAYKLSAKLVQSCSFLNILNVPYRPEEKTLADFLGRIGREKAEGKIPGDLYDDWFYMMTRRSFDLNDAIIRNWHLNFNRKEAIKIAKLLA